MESQRAGALVPRCAWCGRVSIAGEFYEPDEVPAIVGWRHADEMTHSICPDCVETLRRTGRSR